MVTRWEPFAELAALREAMDNLFDRPFVGRRPTLTERTGERVMPVDLCERDGDYVIKAYVPGVKAEEVNLNVDQNTLTIKAHIPGEAESEEAKKYKWLTQELGYGDVSRSINLPGPIDADKIEATVDNGVLTVTVPKAEEVKPKKIQVKGK